MRCLQTSHSGIDSSSDITEETAMDDFLATIGALKDLPRRGWVKRGIPHPESVADHMYHMAMICLTYPWADEADRTRAIEMVLVHDAPEAIAGDVTPSDGVNPEEKREREELGLEFLACQLRDAGSPLAERVVDLWTEFEQCESHVSQIVNQIDLLDPLQQAYRYTCLYPSLAPNPQHPGLHLRDFRAPAVLASITDPHLKGIASGVIHKWDAFDSRRTSSRPFILVVGGPGVGKGTQCAAAAAQLDLAHFSVGDLLRRERADPASRFGAFIGRSMREKVAVPPALAVKLITRAVDGEGTRGKRAVLLDGFPRSVGQLEAFEQAVTNTYSTIMMDCSQDNMLKRLTIRAKSSSREDDDPANLRDRIRKFAESDGPVWEHLSARPNVYKIDCNGSVAEVQALFRGCVEEIIGGGS